MNIEDAKKVKFDFVHMEQHYNGYEISSMWDMMCEQLFETEVKVDDINIKNSSEEQRATGRVNDPDGNEHKVFFIKKDDYWEID
jgi:hypothetical protein